MKIRPGTAGSIKGLYRLRFDTEMEADYQAAAVRHKRLPRTLLFAFLGLCFALAPLYQRAFFDVAGSAAAWLRNAEVAAIGPLAFAAAYATYRWQWRLPTALIQSVAVVVLWVSPLFLRYLALHGGMQYPSSMIGIVVIAIAIFGGFNWTVFSLGSVIVLAVGGAQELQLGGYSTAAWLNLNALVLAGLIAVLGAYATEVSHRLAWANGHLANLLARTDTLTGLVTRAEFDRSFPALLLQAQRDHCGIALALIDVDYFKRINDTHGPGCGDAVLNALGHLLRTRLVRRPLDMAVRFSGEQLLVLWYGVAEESRQQLAATLTAAVAALRVTTPTQQPLTITASCGVIWLLPDHRSSPSRVLGEAAQLLAQARASGRDPVPGA